MPDEENRYNMLDNSSMLEEIRLKKIKQGLIENTDNEQYLKEKKELESRPVSIEEKGKNFWFHYKWTVIITAFILVAASFLTYQALTATKYDTTLMLCTHTYFDDDAISDISDKAAQYVSDIDKNGKISVGVFQARYNDDLQDDTTGFQTAMQSRIMAEIASGDNCLFIIEKDLLDTLADKNVFEDVSKVVGTDGGQKAYGVNISQSRILSSEKFKNVKKDLYLAIRVYKEGSDKKNYDAQFEVLKKIYSDAK